MEDGFGRTIDYLRLSITDRCNLRCRYCMPAAGDCVMPKEGIFARVLRGGEVRPGSAVQKLA